MRGVIFDIKRFAIHDGPGIRTTVFLKGCPLRCAWCHNPESQGFGVETLRGRNGEIAVGREVSPDEVLREVGRDAPFYEESGGGVTFSGGEPLAQPDFLAALLAGCGEMGFHRAVDTSGHAPRATLLRIAAQTDLLLYDLKLAADAPHARYTGVGVSLIRDNLRALCETNTPVEVRVPAIPGITVTDDCLEALGELGRSLPRRLPLRLLPYHRPAMDKYPRFGLTPPLPDTPAPAAEELARWRRRLEETGGFQMVA